MTINYTTGYAGTGKSHTLLKLLPTLPSESTIVLCPTHKAIYRLFDVMFSQGIQIEIKTIHSLLGWIPTINEEAQHVNHIDVTTKLDKLANSPDRYTNIVIDEAGMMSEEMLMEITGKLEEQCNFETDHITLHLFLDPYQLLPVKGKQIQIDPLTTTNLTTQHRSESPDIVELYTKFVHYLEFSGTNQPKDLTTPYSENVLKGDITYFQPKDRLLAYTNEAVGRYNIDIAKKFGITTYEGQFVQLGSLLDLIYCSRFLEPTLDDLLSIYNSGQLKLQNSQINQNYLDDNLYALIQHPDILFIEDDREYVYPVIKGIARANTVRRIAKENAIKDKKQFRWVYALNRAYTMDYSFALTVHKAQGSEFDRVFIDKEDIKKSILNNYYDTYARLMYVALSRAKKRVFLL